MRVIATAGHVDHGKSTLIRALTGTDPDRWAEEKARGMTIDLGFATTTLPSGREVGFVDVPGHRGFLKNMLAGLSAIDACLFVVDASEGWKAQSEEHLRILDLLGIGGGMVALTKVGLVDRDTRELVALDIQDHVTGTFLEGAEIVPVDVIDGVGVDELRAALDRLVGDTPPAVDRGRPRLWVDRSFAIRGAGTVVTGTLAGGSIAVNDELVLAPDGRPVRVRGLESHYGALDRSAPGRRLAVNISGADRRQVARGHALVRPGQWHVTRCVDASLTVLDSVNEPVGTRGAYTVYLGSGDFPARLQLVASSEPIPAGGHGLVRLWLRGAGAPLVPGDRYILRELGRNITVGGGEVLDVDPVLPARRARPTLSVDRIVAERGWVEADDLPRLSGQVRPPNAGRWVVSDAALETTRARLKTMAEAAGSEGVDLAALNEVERAVLGEGIAGLATNDHRLFEEHAVPKSISPAAAGVLAELEKAPWTPPDLPLSDRGALRELQRHGLVCEAGELWFAATAVEAAVSVLRGLLESRPEGFTVSEAREALGTTRKYALPLLSLLDASGVTRRQGDLRVGGPAMRGAPA
jgi:selenocysteine-specific elongation factor